MTERNAETFSALLMQKNYASIKELFETMHCADIATVLEECAIKDMPLLFRLLPKEMAAETFALMDEMGQKLLAEGLSDSKLKELIDELYVDDIVDIAEEMPANVVRRILSQADEATRATINEILKYPQDSAGSIMTTEYVSLHPDMTVEDAIKRIRRTGVDKKTINTCYVVSFDKRLVGFVTIRTLLLSEETDVIEKIMSTDVISSVTGEDRESVALIFQKYDLSVMPVVDEENRLVGIVTFDDVIDVLLEETTEDIEKMGAITPLPKSYLKTGVLEIFKSRIPWLLILMLSSTFTGMIIRHFESALAAQIVLTASIPMLMGTGGNCGSQASVTVIRGLSIGEIKLENLFRIVWKEFRVALLCGICLAIVNFVKLVLLENLPVVVALVICITLFLVVVVAKFVGCSLPLFAHKLGFDPAVMASPFITTIVDAISLLIYFETALVFL